MNNIVYCVCKMLSVIFRLFGKNKFYTYLKEQSKIYKKKTRNNYIPKDIRLEIAFIKAQMYFKQKYNINLPIDIMGTGDLFVLDKIKVGDIKRCWEGKIYSLQEVSPYKYLQTKDKKIYNDYIKKHDNLVDNWVERFTTRNEKNKKLTDVWNSDRMDKVYDSIKTKGYDPSKMCICVDKDNIIIDGQHRACCILYLYGKDYTINVCRVLKS